MDVRTKRPRLLENGIHVLDLTREGVILDFEKGLRSVEELAWLLDDMKNARWQGLDLTETKRSYRDSHLTGEARQLCLEILREASRKLGPSYRVWPHYQVWPAQGPRPHKLLSEWEWDVFLSRT